MNGYVIKTELYKIFSKKYLWVVALFFTVFFALVSLQAKDSIEVQYPLESLQGSLAQAAENPEFLKKADVLALKWSKKSESIKTMSKETKEFLPPDIIAYTEKFRNVFVRGGSVADILNYDIVQEAQYYLQRQNDRQAETERLQNELASMQSMGETESFSYRMTKQEYQLYATAPKIQPNLTRWGEFADLNKTLLPVFIAFLVILGLCGIYSDEYANRTQSEMLTSRDGRAGVFGGKLIAGFIYTAVVTAFFQLVGFGVYAVIFKSPGEDIPLASLPQFYMMPYHFSAQSYYLFQIAGSFLGAFALAAVVMCLSALAKNALFPFFLSGGIFVAGFALKKLVALGAGKSTLLTFPAELSIFMTMSWQELVAHYRVTDLFGNPVSTVWVNLCVAVLVMVAALLLCFRFYTKKQVKN